MTISTTNRMLIDVPLQPVSGSRFQPTGFPNLGAATYSRPDGSGGWVDALIVESAQSMANRLEATAWESGANMPHPVLDGLPYVRVCDAEGNYLTSSREESHRLASAFVKDSILDGTKMEEVIRDRLGLSDDRPIPARSIAAAVFQLDPLCLIHGVFFAAKATVWPGQPKISRALTGFIEATDVRRAESGGVKRDHVRHSISDTGGSAEGYGSVPFDRTEWTAQRIVASFALDRSQIRSYGLGDDATSLLESIALWEVRSLLDGELRLRTACDLMPIDDHIVDQSGTELPGIAELSDRIPSLIARCSELLPDGGDPIDVEWTPKKKSK